MTCAGICDSETRPPDIGGTNEEVQMRRTRMVLAVLSGTIGVLQVWDSGTFGAGAPVVALALAGVGIPSAAIAATSNPGVRFVALAAGFVLLTIARMMAPFSLNTLHLALFVPAIYILVASRQLETRKMGAI
jgi:hypothetical protein